MRRSCLFLLNLRFLIGIVFKDPLLITLGVEMGVLVDLGVNQKLVPGSESKVIMDFSRLCEEDCILL